jgi:hypothetical protein
MLSVETRYKGPTNKQQVYFIFSSSIRLVSLVNGLLDSDKCKYCDSYSQGIGSNPISTPFRGSIS